MVDCASTVPNESSTSIVTDDDGTTNDLYFEKSKIKDDHLGA
jgi:hypothetical protein